MNPYRQPVNASRRAHSVVAICRASMERSCGFLEPHHIEALKRVLDSDADDEIKHDAQALIDEAQA